MTVQEKIESARTALGVVNNLIEPQFELRGISALVERSLFSLIHGAENNEEWKENAIYIVTAGLLLMTVFSRAQIIPNENNDSLGVDQSVLLEHQRKYNTIYKKWFPDDSQQTPENYKLFVLELGVAVIEGNMPFDFKTLWTIFGRRIPYEEDRIRLFVENHYAKFNDEARANIIQKLMGEINIFTEYLQKIPGKIGNISNCDEFIQILAKDTPDEAKDIPDDINNPLKSEKSYTLYTLEVTLGIIISAIIGMSICAAIGFVLGDVTGAIIGGVTGFAAGGGISNLFFTMWPNKKDLHNQPIVDPYGTELTS